MNLNCGFEDVFVLDQLMEQHNGDLAKVLPAYTEARKDNGNAIADLSLRNFIEMRDLVADPEFLLRKRIEGRIYSRHPQKWVPLYSQVKFTNIPYAQALSEGQRHDKIMQSVLQMPNIEQLWDSDDVEQHIQTELG